MAKRRIDQPGTSSSRNSSLAKQIEAQVRRFNAKLLREAQKHPEYAGILPEKMSVRAAKQSIKTAKDLRVLKNSVNRLFEPQALQPVVTQGNVTTTKWQVREAELAVTRINRRRAQQRAKIDISPYKGNMGMVEAMNWAPKRTKANKVGERNWKRFIASVAKQGLPSYFEESSARYKKAYIAAAKKFLGSYADQIVDVVSRIPNEKFLFLSLDDPILHISYTSDPLPASEITENILERLSRAGYA